MQIEILELRILPEGRTLKAFCDIRVGDWTIREFRVIKDNGKRPRVVVPQVSWKGPDGQVQYKTLITLPDELKGEIDRIVLNRFFEEVEKRDEQRAGT